MVWRAIKWLWRRLGDFFSVRDLFDAAREAGLWLALAPTMSAVGAGLIWYWEQAPITMSLIAFGILSGIGLLVTLAAFGTGRPSRKAPHQAKQQGGAPEIPASAPEPSQWLSLTEAAKFYYNRANEEERALMRELSGGVFFVPDHDLIARCRNIVIDMAADEKITLWGAPAEGLEHHAIKVDEGSLEAKGGNEVGYVEDDHATYFEVRVAREELDRALAEK